MIALDLRKADPATVRADGLVVAAARDNGAARLIGPADRLVSSLGRDLHATLDRLGFTGKQGEVATVPTGGSIRAPLLVVAGVGDAGSVTPETLRRAAGAGVRAARTGSVALALPDGDDATVQAVCEGAALGAYTFDAYRSAEPPQVDKVIVLSERARQQQPARDAATAVSSAVCRARDWVNTPPRDLTPAAFADRVAEIERPGRLSMEVWDEARLASEGCGGILGVGQGSANPPRLVILRYQPRRAVRHLALVGKGITYDSGGITLKNSAGLMTMKCDMAGAAAVVNATVAIAQLGVPVAVTCLAALAENMPSGSATRPGDVLRIRGGRTVEVLNTDAEGRLVLADALVLAGEADADPVVDVATLTGACVVALGNRTAGVMSNDEATQAAVIAAAREAGEEVWPLPIPEEMGAKVASSTVADLRQHNPDTSGGALFAAAFLREFVGDRPWAHLDIAGPAFSEGEPHGYTPKGGTGFATRTLIRLAQDLSAG